MKLKLLSISAFLAVLASSACATTWLNETSTPAEADFARLMAPISITLNTGLQTPDIFGQLFESGATNAPGAPAGWVAQVGYGPAGTSPLVSGLWVWVAATWSSQVSNNDEFKASFVAPAAGSYSYTFRFSSDAFASATAADLDGAGSNIGADFSSAQLGTLTVTGAPEPSGNLLVLAGTAVVLSGRRRWLRRPLPDRT